MRIQEVDIHAPGIAEYILIVQVAAYEIESRLIEYPEFPPLWETPEKLRNSGERFFVCLNDGSLAGVISFAIENDVADICRLVVSPDHMGNGIGTALVREVEGHCNSCSRITVSTAWKNVPAIRLYEKCGFTVSKRWFLPDGLELVALEKTRGRRA